MQFEDKYQIKVEGNPAIICFIKLQKASNLNHKAVKKIAIVDYLQEIR